MTKSVFLFLIISFGGFNSFAQSTSSDTDAKLLSSTSYAMPQKATDALIDGKVVMGIHVDENGAAKKAWLVSGPAWPCGQTPVKAIEELAASLSDAMTKLKFSPAVKAGKPVESDVGLAIELKNPEIWGKGDGPVLDPVTGKPIPKIVNGGVINGKAVSLPKPAYPVEARAARQTGGVTVLVVIDEQGNVMRAGALSGASGLQFAARAAACEAKFSPTTLSGHPVKVTGVITYNFNP